MTRITLTDPILIEQLRRAKAGVLRDPEGRLLGSFAVVTPDGSPGDDPCTAKSPEAGAVQSATPPEADA